MQLLKLNTIFNYSVYLKLTSIYLTVCLFLVPYGYSFFKLFGPIILTFFALCTIISHRKEIEVNKNLSLLLLLVLLASLFTKSPHFVGWTFFIESLIFTTKIQEIKVSPEVFSIAALISFFFTVIYAFFYSHGGRLRLSMSDPNYSALYLLLLLYFLYIARQKVFSIIVAFLILGTLSRTGIFAVLIFAALRFFPKSLKHKIDFLSKPKTLFTLFIFLNLTLVLLSLFITDPTKEIYYKGWQRLINFQDSALLYRFQSLRGYVHEIVATPIKFITGWGNDYIPYFTTHYHDDIHNSFFAISAKSGILFAAFYFYTLFTKSSLKLFTQRYEILTSYFIFSLGLHGGFFTFPIAFMIVLSRVQFSDSR